MDYPIAVTARWVCGIISGTQSGQLAYAKDGQGFSHFSRYRFWLAVLGCWLLDTALAAPEADVVA